MNVPGRKFLLLTLLLAAALLSGCAAQSERAGHAEATAATPSGHGSEPPRAASDRPPRPGAELEEVVEETFGLPAESLQEPLPPEQAVEGASADPCLEGSDRNGWLDRARRGIAWTVCGSARWFDGFFGDRRRYDAELTESHGRIGIYGYHDERNGFDPDLRFRAKLALPALKERARVFVGRGDERELIEERAAAESTVPPAPGDVDRDTSFLVGLGFQRGKNRKRGFDSSVGIRVRFPPEPYAKIGYREYWDIGENTIFRWRQTGFWRQRRGFGTTSDFDFDQLLARQLLLRWANSGTIAEDRKGLDWFSSLNLFQGLSNHRALTYRTFLAGETGRDVPLKNYGLELRYRQRVLRKWLFVEFIGSATWPRFAQTEERDLNLGAGLGFEMYFGPVPDRDLR